MRVRLITRAEALRALLVAPLLATRPSIASTFLQADDKSWDMSLPDSWQLQGEPLRQSSAESPRLFQARAEDASAQISLEVVVQFASAGQKSLKDLGAMNAVAARYLAQQPQPATLVQAIKLPRPDLFSTSLYQFRFLQSGGESESVVKLALQQGRLYELSVTIPAGANEVDTILQSFKTYPLNIGCLSASNRGGSFLPGVCY